MNYRRTRAPGATYFFTVVTHGRRPFLCDDKNVSLLRESFRSIMEKHPFKIDAFVLLPDHLHSIWTLPEEDDDYSSRWRMIKSFFSRHCSLEHAGPLLTSRRNKRERAVWQRRFWEHAIRDDEDFAKHVDYIHYNPVKHGFVSSPLEWKHSSFHKFVRTGVLDVEWGASDDMDFGDDIGNE